MNLLFAIYNDSRTIFSFKDICLLIKESNVDVMKQRVNYLVKTKKILALRRGIYAKSNYDKTELASKIYKPSYISLEYVLRKSGLIFQYDTSITVVSYLSRIIDVDGNQIEIKKIKNNILLNTQGIIRAENGVNIATPERAILDQLYLKKDFYFDTLSNVDYNKIVALLPLYNSVRLTKFVTKQLKT